VAENENEEENENEDENSERDERDENSENESKQYRNRLSIDTKTNDAKSKDALNRLHFMKLKS
jgi:U3 small nucleolar RNA-associated protein 14